MNTDRTLVNDIVTEHRERMLNLKKYYPFFRLSETSFAWYKDGRFDNLDMGYILMAVLRFFIEENNFKEKDVSYGEYAAFMSKCFKRDFGLEPDPEETRVLTDYIFDKLKNDGKPFAFTYYDPVDRTRKVSRVKLLESRIEDGTVWYSISSDGIEFYLDTKEIRDESKISVEQLLLEKMIGANDFKGGTAVVTRINEEVKRLWYRKNQVIDLLTADVFAGVKAYREFFETGMKWFDEEQKLFARNKELIEATLKRSEGEAGTEGMDRFYRTANEIYRLDTELKVAMNNHSELIRECTDLGLKADAIIRKAKLTRLRNRFDFKSALETMERADHPENLRLVIEPFLDLKIRKGFDFERIDDLIGYRALETQAVEKITEAPTEDLVFEDELEEKRFAGNARTLFRILLELLSERDHITLKDYHERALAILGEALTENRDYYTFLIHLCEKTDYLLTDSGVGEETFLDELIHGYMAEPALAQYIGMHFILTLAGGEEEELHFSDQATVTNFRIERI